MAQSAAYRKVTIHEWAHANGLLYTLWIVLALLLLPCDIQAQKPTIETPSIYEKYAKAPIAKIYHDGMDYLSHNNLDSALACLNVAISHYRDDMNDEEKRILKSPQPVVNLQKLNNSSVDLVVKAWVNSSENDYLGVMYGINEAVYKTFAEEGLNIPFPQVDVHMKA